MNRKILLKKREEIITNYGPWTAHNIHIVDNIYTISNEIVGDEIKLRRIMQIISDCARQDFSKLRILDLACLEGLYAVECARRGASVVGVEGRMRNIVKAQFVKDALELRTLELAQDDVRNVSQKNYGSFSVVLCLGILYHLEAKDCISFMRSIHEMCERFTIIDTHISKSPQTQYAHEGIIYHGEIHAEHGVDSTPEQRQNSLWASLDNETSFWFTRQSLYQLLLKSGFSSVYECHIPEEPKKKDDRLTLLAIKGVPQKLISCPQVYG